MRARVKLTSVTWLSSAPDAGTPFEAALGLRPELLEGYRTFYGSLWDEKLLPARLLELCRQRIAAIHGCGAEAAVRHAGAGVSASDREAVAAGQGPATLTALERVALDVVEKVPFAIHAIVDEEIEALRQGLGEAGVVAFLVAVTLFDSSCRLRLALGVESRRESVQQPASTHGPLY
jgi:alkylhydroperoxidase family enzyme